MSEFLSNGIVKLRAPEPEDLDFLFKWENNTAFWGNGSTLVPYSRFSLKQHIEEAGKDIFETRQLRMMLVDEASNQPIGVVDLFDFDPFNNRAGVGILIDSTYQKKGFATQALLMLKNYAFNFLRMNQLHATISEKNIPSQNLFRLCGFVPAGTLKKWNKVGGDFEDVLIFQCFPSI